MNNFNPLPTRKSKHSKSGAGDKARNSFSIGADILKALYYLLQMDNK